MQLVRNVYKQLYLVDYSRCQYDEIFVEYGRLLASYA